VLDLAFPWTTRVLAFIGVGLLGLIGLLLALNARLAFETFGLGFVTGTTWDPVRDVYGALPYVAGTLASSFLALLIAAPVGVLAAVYVAELAPRRVGVALTFLIELLAAIPSVVIGLWGVFVLSPFLRATVESWIVDTLGWIPLFRGPAFGIGLFAAGVILAIMILPTIVSISREVIVAVPRSQREAMLALGATRWEVVSGAVLPYARSGIIGAVILGLGRALGETMAVTMVIGNRHDISLSVLQPGYTMAAAIANEFAEATTDLYLSALFEEPGPAPLALG